jgi:hypothetical protein
VPHVNYAVDYRPKNSFSMSYASRKVIFPSVRLLPIIAVLASFVGTMVNVDGATPKNERLQSINRESTISGVASCIIQGLCYGVYL